MGTRNLTMVIHKEKPVIAQYGQWDGYPDGQGCTALSFLSTDGNIDKLKGNLSKIRFIDPEGVDKVFIEEYEKNAPPYMNSEDKRTPEQKSWFTDFITRDIAAEILENVAFSEKEEILLKDGSDFVNDSLFCEWAYVIDLDKNTFEVYESFGQSPLPETDRFYCEKPNKGGYYPVKLVKSYDLDKLPDSTEFCNDFKKEDEDED